MVRKKDSAPLEWTEGDPFSSVILYFLLLGKLDGSSIMRYLLGIKPRNTVTLDK